MFPRARSSFTPTAVTRAKIGALVATPILTGALALVLMSTLVASPEQSAEARESIAPRAEAVAVVHPAPLALQLPTLALEPAIEAAPAPAPAPAAAPASWSISIGAVGLQAELDQCQWVRMDFSSAVPLPVVGAHNYCGGDIVLSMGVGETVTLAGAGLDGSYVVTGSRDAWTDSPAADAIAGMGGDVILQTCYWANDGSERLVSLQRI
jgi:hypothetical protein